MYCAYCFDTCIHGVAAKDWPKAKDKPVGFSRTCRCGRRFRIVLFGNSRAFSRYGKSMQKFWRDRGHTVQHIWELVQ